MLDIKEIDIDLQRCEKVLEENDYMEIVIAIEELQDKYRELIENISENENDVVWNYNKRDLERIKEYIDNYRREVILKERLKDIDEKLENLKKYMYDNTEKEENLDIIIHLIEEVNKKNTSLDEKYEELKTCFSLLKDLDRRISVYVLDLIRIIISD